MERMRVLIADDDKAHLEKVFEIVNAKDPLPPEGKVWTGEGRLVDEVLSNRSAREFPLRLEGNIEILCAQSYEGALSLNEEHGDVDICLSDIQLSDDEVDGPSILIECGVSPTNGILYTGQSEKQQNYEDSEAYIEGKKDYPGATPGRFRVVRFELTKDFEDVIYRFLMDSEYLLAEDRIPDTGLSSEAKASWRSFEKELNSLFSGDRPYHGDWQKCDTALNSEGGLEMTRFGGIQFKHLFPFRDAFLKRRLSEVEAIVEGRADGAYPSWSRVKNKMKVRAEEISRLINEGDPGDDGGPGDKEKPKKVKLDLNSPTEEALSVKTNKGSEYNLSNIRNMGIFLILAIKLRDSDNVPVDGPVTTNYKKWSPPLLLSAVLMDEIRNAKRGYASIERYRFKYKSVEKEEIYDEGWSKIKKRKIEAEDILGNEYSKKEDAWKKGTDLVKKYMIQISSPSNGANHKGNVKDSAPEGVPDRFADIISADVDYEMSEEIEELNVKPNWIERKKESNKKNLYEELEDILS
jgi:CheY-like chemotaxis protein